MTSICVRMLYGALIIMCLSVTACDNTCLDPSISYSGQMQGRTFVKLSSTEVANRSLVMFPTVDAALHWFGNGSPGAGGSCWKVAGTETWTLEAWIDVGALDTDDVCRAWSACVFHPGDPMGMMSTQPFGNTTVKLHVAISDPP
jgi:hypothetical protein